MTGNKDDTLRQAFDSILKDAEMRAELFNRDPSPKIYIGKATCGLAAGALETQRSFEESLDEHNIKAIIKSVGCIGHCYAEPVVIIDYQETGYPPIFYHQVTPGKARMLVKAFLKDGDPLFEHMLGAMKENDMIPQVMDYPRFSNEERIVMEKCGLIDPGDIHEYISLRGYSTLCKTLQLPREKILEEVISSGLRGRGGAGFLTGKKWGLVESADSSEKIVICNADEGDPGAYMDRTILESNPHQLIEGMAICAYAVEAIEVLSI